MLFGGFIEGQTQGNSLAARMIFSIQFDHLEEIFSWKEVLLKKFRLPVKTSYPPAENINEILVLNLYPSLVTVTLSSLLVIM